MKEKHLRVGILGGSFAPVHHGHLWIAAYVRECFELQQVVFVPTGYHPFKGALSDTQHRWNMLQLALQGEVGFSLSRVELDEEQPAYTYETMVRLCRELGTPNLYFILGSDNLKELGLWHRGEDLLRDFHIIAVGRNEENLQLMIEEDSLLLAYKHHIHPVNAPFAFDLSSSFVRQRIRVGQTIRYLVPAEVEDYIGEHRLYRHEKIGETL